VNAARSPDGPSGLGLTGVHGQKISDPGSIDVDGFSGWFGIGGWLIGGPAARRLTGVGSCRPVDLLIFLASELR
jgi:hypothetical protein